MLTTGVFFTSLLLARGLAAEPASAASTAASPKPTPLVKPTPIVIAIDAGHGGVPNNNDPSQGWDPGVVANGLMEKDITLDLAGRLQSKLQQERVNVVMTRTTDRFMSIADRWAIVGPAHPDYFVSFHINAYDGDSSINGSTILYPTDASLNFAQAIESSLAASLAPYGIKDDGTQSFPQLWQHATMPTVTLEPVYLTNPREASLLRDGNFLDAIATGVFKGLLAYAPQIATTKTALDRYDAALAARAAAARKKKQLLNPWLVIPTGLGLSLILFRRRQRKRPPRGVARYRAHAIQSPGRGPRKTPIRERPRAFRPR